MASVEVVKFTTDSSVAFSVDGLGQQSADATSNVLQKNHDEHDFIYTDWGAHSKCMADRPTVVFPSRSQRASCAEQRLTGDQDHIVHHVSTVFALGATPGEIDARYHENVPDQRPPPAEDKAVTGSLHDRSTFTKLIGIKTTLYTSFLVFFTNRIQEKGWQIVCNEYLFTEDELSNTMLRRLCSGELLPSHWSCFKPVVSTADGQ